MSTRPSKCVARLTASPYSLALLACLALATACSRQPSLTAKAQAGDIEAQLTLARLYETGDDRTPQDPAMALRWYRQAAEQGDPSAQYELGRMLSNVNATEAESWFRKSAKQGHAGAIKHLEAQRPPPLAGANLEERIRQAELLHQEHLARRESVARELPKLGSPALRDLRERVLEMKLEDPAVMERRARELSKFTESIAAAHFRMGQKFETGDGFLLDMTEAAKWYRLAADQGHAGAQSNLGRLYMAGQGVEKNQDEAIGLYRLAAEHGLAEAQYNLAVSYLKGEGVEKNSAEAAKWLKLAAEQGLALAQNTLGTRYERGDGVPKDLDEALRLYRLAAAQGNREAQANIGARYFSGQGVTKDPSVAVEWFRKAAEQGLPAAQYLVGTQYAEGVGVPRDLVEANVWLTVSDYFGYSHAKDKLIKLQGTSTPAQISAADTKASELIRKIEQLPRRGTR